MATNIIQAQESMKELSLENVVLTKHLNKVRLFIPLGVIILFMLGLSNGLPFFVSGVVLGIVGFLNVRSIQREVYMNNMMIVLAHSCIQSEYNSDYNPANDSVITSKSLIK